MEYGSASERTEPRQPHPGYARCIVSSVILLSSVASVDSPYPTWAAVYQCLDAAGKTVLTDRPTGLHSCHVLSEGTASAPMPPGPNALPQLPPQNALPIPSHQPPDSPGPPIGPLPPPNPAAPSSPPSAQPCHRGVNPLNPLTTPPCTQSDQSGARPPGPEATPAPPQ
jgi:hypothetical protein